MNHGVILGYKDIYKENYGLDFVQSLKGIKAQELIYILTQVNTWISEKRGSNEILYNILSTKTISENFQAFRKLNNLKENQLLFHTKPCINFILKVIENKDRIDAQYDEKDEFSEMNFLYNLLKLNEESFGSGVPFPKVENEYYEEFMQTIFYSKTLNFDRSLDLFYELLRIKVLVSYFFENDNEIFTEFCNFFSISNFDEWFINLFNFLHQNYYDIFFFDLDEDDDLQKFFDYQLLNINENNETSFDHIHVKPIYKIDSKYLIIDKRFYFHNIYNVIDYKLFKILQSKNRVNSYSDYKSKTLSSEINEKKMFRFLISELFGNKNYFKIMFSENDGSPDAFLQYENKIYLFEFKDNLINNKTLDSYKYEHIKHEIDRLLIKDIDKRGKEKKKGISQLVSYIENIHYNDTLDTKKIKIFPILILTDDFLSLPMVENYLTSELKKQIALKVFNFRSVSPLTVINIKGLIEILSCDFKVNFIKLMNNYSVKKKKFRKKNNPFQKFPSFNNEIPKHSFGNKGFLKKIFLSFPTTKDETYLKQFLN